MTVRSVWIVGRRVSQGVDKDAAVDQWYGSAAAIHQGSRGIEAEQMVSGGENVFGRNGPFKNIAGDLVRLADDAAASHAAAGKNDAVDSATNDRGRRR